MAADTFTEFVRDQLRTLEDLEFRSMFGGYGLYLKDRFFAILFKGKLYFKTCPESLLDYRDAGSKPFVYKKAGKKTVKLKNYYDVPVDVLENRRALEKWARRAAAG